MTDKFEDYLNSAVETSKQIIDGYNVAEQKRQEAERLKKEQSEWKIGNIAKSAERFEEFLKKGYKPTYEACGGAKLSELPSENALKILKLACQYGLEPEESTKLFVQSKSPEIMEILVKKGKADVCKYPVAEIKKWYDTPDKVFTETEKINRKVINPRAGMYDGDRGFEPDYYYEPAGYKIVRHVIKPSEGSMPAFRKLVELGYKPETIEDAQAFAYMAEKLKEIIAEEKRIAERKLKEQAEGKRRDSEIEKIGDFPLGQKLIASALIKGGVMDNHTQVDSLYDFCDGWAGEEITRLQKEGIVSEKFEILKPYEFIKSSLFDGKDIANIPIANVPIIKEFVDSVKKQQDALNAAKESMLQKIYDDTKLQDIVADIKQMDQETVNYLADAFAKASGRFAKAKNIDKEEKPEIKDFHKIKLLGVYLTLYDKSSDKTKNTLATELLKWRIGYYSNLDKKEMLDLFQKAKNMLKGELDTDTLVKGLTRKSYTPFSSLNRALRKNNKEL